MEVEVALIYAILMAVGAFAVGAIVFAIVFRKEINIGVVKTFKGDCPSVLGTARCLFVTAD